MHIAIFTKETIFLGKFYQPNTFTPWKIHGFQDNPFPGYVEPWGG